MSENLAPVTSAHEAGHYVSEMLGISVKADGLELLLRIGEQTYRIDFRKCSAEETLSDSTELFSALSDTHHERLHDVQNRVHEMCNEVVHLLDEIRIAEAIGM